jgi:DNA-binding NarL/FixJ family response regulator
VITADLTSEHAAVANLTMMTSANLSPSPRILRVVIVEDSRNIRERLVQLVEDNGSMQVVGEADTEESAVAVCRSTAPDAIILDLKLANGTGLGVLKTMCYAGAEHKPAIIVLTNFPWPAFERAAQRLGADWFLDKSSEFHKLPGLLQGLLEKPPTEQ